MELYLQIAFAFTAVALFSRIAKITQSFNPAFYILAGIITGPLVLGLVTNIEVIKLFGEIGLVFLLFYLGFEFSLNKLINNFRSLMIAGTIDFIVNFSVGLLIGKIIGLDLFHSFVVAGIIYMSSSGIVTKTLIQLNAIKDPEGELVMGIMVFEDLFMVFFLVFISTLSKFSEGIQWAVVGKDIAIALVFCIVLVVIGKRYSKLIDRFLKSESREITLLSFLCLVFIVTAIGIEMGVSEALGAFFLGMAVSEGKSKKQVENTAIIFKDIFGSMFFFYFGMNFTLGDLSLSIPMIIMIVLLAILGKLLSSILISRFLKCTMRNGIFIGLVTVSRGEFSLLIASIVGNDYFNFGTFSVLLVISTVLFSTIGFRLANIICNKKGLCLLPKLPFD